MTRTRGRVRRAHLFSVALLVSLAAFTSARTQAFGLTPALARWSRPETSAPAPVSGATAYDKSSRHRTALRPYRLTEMARMSPLAANADTSNTLHATQRGRVSAKTATPTESGVLETPISGLDTVENTGPSTVASISAKEEPRAALAVATTMAKADKKAVVNAFPGTRWSAGLPKWMHVVLRRMLTKKDWLHVHATSSLVRSLHKSRYFVDVRLVFALGFKRVESTSTINVVSTIYRYQSLTMFRCGMAAAAATHGSLVIRQPYTFERT